jgi:hypothetical protein
VAHLEVGGVGDVHVAQGSVQAVGKVKLDVEFSCFYYLFYFRQVRSSPSELRV